LLFGLDHPDILHSGVRDFSNQVCPRDDDLARLD
jgi:hypothetical protein